MKQIDFQSMSIDELWSLHENLHAILVEKVEAELQTVQGRLAVMNCSSGRARRLYPPVKAKFRNPRTPSETWAGRGHQPNWMRDQLAAGTPIDDLRAK